MFLILIKIKILTCTTPPYADLLSILLFSEIAVDSMKEHNGKHFTAKDRDNDNNPTANCAELFTGAFWYDNCHDVNINGVYYERTDGPISKGVNWRDLKTNSYSLKKTEMKIRRK